MLPYSDKSPKSWHPATALIQAYEDADEAAAFHYQFLRLQPPAGSQQADRWADSQRFFSKRFRRHA